MINIRDQIEISRPQKQVFAFLTDLENIPNWQAEVVKSTVVTPGPVQAGTKFDEVVKIGPFRVATHCVVTAYEPDRLLGVEAKSSPVNYGGTFTVESAGSGSRVALDARAQLRGLWKVFQPVLAGDIRKGARQELAALKRHCEEAPSAVA